MKTEMITGVGVGLRQAHYQTFLAQPGLVPWLEILSDNYLFSHGLLREKILALRANYPMVMHGVGLNIGSVDPLNQEYLQALKSLAQVLEPSWISDHLCWTGVNSRYSHDLLPLPYTEEALQHVVSRVQQVQDSLGYPLLLENVSSYLQVQAVDYREADFLNAVAKQSGCCILLDVNNVFVSAHNHQYDPLEYFSAIEARFVKQFHLAGFERKNDLLIDTHGAPVAEAVWQLYRTALQYFPDTPTNIEWDNKVPSWDVLQQEVAYAAALGCTKRVA